MNYFLIFVVLMLVFFFAGIILSGLAGIRASSLLNGNLNTARNYLIASYILIWIALAAGILAILTHGGRVARVWNDDYLVIGFSGLVLIMVVLLFVAFIFSIQAASMIQDSDLYDTDTNIRKAYNSAIASAILNIYGTFIFIVLAMVVQVQQNSTRIRYYSTFKNE